jgi:tetratricopeptide (TPR) repeat protein
VVLPLALFGTAEGLLRLTGVGQSLQLIVPANPDIQLSAARWRLNPDLDRAYYGVTNVSGPEPRPVARPRPEGTFRVLVVGASTVIGFPYPAELAFPRQVEVLLEQQWPELDVEVLNAGMTALNSFAMADVVRQARLCDPDLIVVHAGHNEFYGPDGIASRARHVPQQLVPWTYRLRRLRLLQLMSVLHSRPDEDTDLITALPATLDLPLDSELFQTAAESYRRNLEQMVAVSRGQGIPLLLTTVASNLRDQSPLRTTTPSDGSESAGRWKSHAEQGLTAFAGGQFREALDAFAAAEAADRGSALVAYRMAQCRERLGDLSGALEGYRRARDLDLCRFRAPSSFSRIVREVAEAAGSDNVLFLDTAAALDAVTHPRAPGFDLFLEHVHYRFEGHYELARVLARFIQTRVHEKSWIDARTPTPAEMRTLLGMTSEDDLAAWSIALQTLQTPPLSGAVDAEAHQAALRDEIGRRYAALSLQAQERFADLSLDEMQSDLIGALQMRAVQAGHLAEAAEFARLGVVRQPWSTRRHEALKATTSGADKTASAP